MLHGKPGGYKKSAHLNDGKDIGINLAGGFYDAGGACIMLLSCTILRSRKLQPFSHALLATCMLATCMLARGACICCNDSCMEIQQFHSKALQGAREKGCT
jgi:hypothetical protein